MNFKLPETVSLDILDTFMASGNYLDNSLILDFSGVKYIDPEGALSLICFCAALRWNIIAKSPNQIEINFIPPPQNVLFYLTSLGFFSQLCYKAEIKNQQNLIYNENQARSEKRLKNKFYYNNNTITPIIFPIETIPQSNGEVSSRDFENMTRTFINRATTTFFELFELTYYNFNKEDEHSFLLSNVELYKNIYEHSKSWGIATIHARPNFGTTVCYFDIGIGFKESVGKYDTEKESIEWALIDENTSKVGDENDGFGLTIVQDFVLRRKGKLKIRSGDCLLIISETSKQIKKVSKFPGVQLSYFIPI